MCFEACNTSLNYYFQSLEQKLERDFYSGLFRWDEVHQNDVSGLLKRFIRELPAPLLTAEYLPAFAAVQSKFLFACFMLFSGEFVLFLALGSPVRCAVSMWI